MNPAAEWIRRHAFDVVLLATIIVGGFLLNGQADDIRSNTHLIQRNQALAAQGTCERGNIIRSNQRAVLIHEINEPETPEATRDKFRAALRTIPLVDCSKLPVVPR